VCVCKYPYLILSGSGTDLDPSSREPTSTSSREPTSTSLHEEDTHTIPTQFSISICKKKIEFFAGGSGDTHTHTHTPQRDMYAYRRGEKAKKAKKRAEPRQNPPRECAFKQHWTLSQSLPLSRHTCRSKPRVDPRRPLLPPSSLPRFPRTPHIAPPPHTLFGFPYQGSLIRVIWTASGRGGKHCVCCACCVLCCVGCVCVVLGVCEHRVNTTPHHTPSFMKHTHPSFRYLFLLASPATRSTPHRGRYWY
jgi:hypothetical protein